MTRLVVSVCLLLLAPLVGAGPQRSAVILNYQEQEPGTASYPVRMLVTDDYLRIDDGIDSGDYLLLDRQQRTLFNVTHARRNILVIPYTEFDHQAGAGDFRTLVTTDEAAPRVADTAVRRVNLVADEEVCMTATVVPGLLPEARAALGEYLDILASRQHRDLDLMPASMRTPCFYANYVYGNTRHLEHGLPIQLSIRDGRTRMLIDYRREATVPTGLFELPGDYERVRME